MNLETLETYKRRLAQYLRQQEAGHFRGQMSRLDALDEVTDEDLLRKWAWLFAICSCLFAFLGLPMAINVFRAFMPYELAQFLWLVDKVSMFVSMGMFAIALFLTVRRNA